MPSVIDQLGREIILDKFPRRIISLVPSQTELLADLGLEEEVVGITKFCVHPEAWFHSKQRIGGTKQVNLSTIQQLRPDLIIANKEENAKEQVEELARQFPVYTSDVHDLSTALQMMSDIGQITNTIDRANRLVEEIETSFQALPAFDLKPAAYLIWKDPFMTVGGDTFIHQMMMRAGFQNVFGERSRYPSVTIEELKESGCAYLLLSSEPYPFKQQHIDELSAQLPDCKIMLVDGEYFSWYGSRLLHAAAYFNKLQEQLKTA